MLSLGIDGFSFEDLYRSEGLERLHARFLKDLEQTDPALATRFAAYRAAKGENEKGPQQSDLLIQVAAHVSRFVGQLFGVHGQLGALQKELTGQIAKHDVRIYDAQLSILHDPTFRRDVENEPAPGP